MTDSVWDNGRPGSNTAGVEGRSGLHPPSYKEKVPKGEVLALGVRFLGAPISVPI